MALALLHRVSTPRCHRGAQCDWAAPRREGEREPQLGSVIVKKALAIAALTAVVPVTLLAPSAPGAQNKVGHSATGSGHQDDIDAATGVFN